MDVTEPERALSMSTGMHKKACFKVFKEFIRVVAGECCVFHVRPVTRSGAAITGETTAAALGAFMSRFLTLAQM